MSVRGTGMLVNVSVQAPGCKGHTRTSFDINLTCSLSEWVQVHQQGQHTGVLITFMVMNLDCSVIAIWGEEGGGPLFPWQRQMKKSMIFPKHACCV